MCEQCGDYTRPQLDSQTCAPDKCGDNERVQRDGTCAPYTQACGELQILSPDGTTCQNCYPYTRPSKDGKTCGQDPCPKGQIQFDGTCCKECGYYNTRLTAEREIKEVPQVETKEEGGNSGAIVVISILSAAILGLLAFIAFKFRSGTKAVPPSAEYEVAEVQRQPVGPVEVGPTAKKLVPEESFDKIDEEVPQENIHDSVKIPIAAAEE